jgi:hypothetical protein
MVISVPDESQAAYTPEVLRRLAAALLLSLSCRESTQLTVVLRGEGFECPPTGRPTSFLASSLVASPQIPATFDAASAPRWTDCVAGDPTDDRVELGDVVLVPAQGGAGPVEIAAFASIETTQGATPVERCIELYDTYRASPALLPPAGDAEREFDRCIVARRSLGFVQHSSLRLEIALSSACAGVLCPASQTCVAGECRSAETSCGPEGCDVEGGAGPGAGGAGGTGGNGGAGGTGGGGAEGPWVELPVSAAPLRDVVAYEQGLEFHVWVTDGDQLQHFADADEQPPVVVDDTPRSVVEGYRALAVRENGTDVAAIGEVGIWRSDLGMAAPEYPPGWFAGAGDADRHAIAWSALVEPFWAEGGAFCTVYPPLSNDTYEPGPLSCGVALASVAVGGTTAYAAARSGFLQVDAGPGDVSVSPSLSPSMDWSLWLRSGSAAPPLHVIAARAEAPSVVTHGLGTVYQQFESSSDFAIEDLAVLDRGTTFELFAVSADGLFHLSIPETSSLGATSAVWAPLALPTMQPEAVWVGANSQGLKPRIVVVGERDGVGVAHWANVDDLLP